MWLTYSPDGCTVYLTTGISYYGPPAHACQYCGAQFWHQERVKRSYSGEGGCIRFHLCCRGGKVVLPFQRDPPQFLAGLLDPHGDVLSKYFIKSIRSYNSMFAFTSLGAKIDTGINKEPGPYVFKINGQVHHRIGSLLPDEGKPPVYAQLYILTLKMSFRIECQFLIGTGSAIKIMELIKKLLKAWYGCSTSRMSW